MFEQSIILNHGGSQKTGAFAASFVAQIFVAGVLIVIPLIFTDSLRIVPMVAQLPMLVASAPPPLPTIEPAAPRSVRSTGLQAPRFFVPPVAIRTATTPAAQAIVIDSGPAGFEVATSIGGLDLGLSGGLSPTRIVGPAREARETASVVTKSVDVITEGPLRVTGSLQSSKIIKRVIPAYPTAARVARISGAVHLLGIIGTDGRIRELKVLDGPLLLRQAAVDAVKQWIYSPTILSGSAVEVEAPITVDFLLG
jgi:protein TonB